MFGFKYLIVHTIEDNYVLNVSWAKIKDTAKLLLLWYGWVVTIKKTKKQPKCLV